MSIQITNLMRTGRGLCASFDPAAGPERAAAFKADVERLFTAPTGTAPVVPPTVFKRGDEVRITIEPAEVTAPHDGGLYYRYPAVTGTDYRFIRLDSDAVTVEHLPADPPPMERKPAPDRTAPIELLGFGAHVRNLLRRDGIHTVGWLLAHSELELSCIRNFGPVRLREVRDVLAAHGLELKS